MLTNYYSPTLEDRKETKRGRVLKWTVIGVLVLILVSAVIFIFYEMHTSRLQSREFSRYASSLNYKLVEGPGSEIVYPEGGPYDLRLGYAHLPKLLERSQKSGLQIASQTAFSQRLKSYTSRGYFVPYPEKAQAGLQIADAQGDTIYRFMYPRRVYASFDSLPSLLVNALLFIENRDLLNQEKPFMNPAIDWVRFTKASMHEAARQVGFDYNTIGGSTLATQMEKYRHSPAGRTSDANEKLRQMVSASVRVYQNGQETLPARRELVLSYINSVPLSGAPGYGEVHGMGDGLWVWFGAEFNKINHLLRLRTPAGEALAEQGQALRQVLSLMIAQRRPSYYLSPEGHQELNALTGSYLRLLAKNGYISQELRDAGLAQDVQFRDFGNNPVVVPQETKKGVLMVRTYLSRLMNKPLYDLDRMDLSATTTLHNNLQEQVSTYLNQLTDPEFATTVGVVGKNMLSADHTREVIYSFTLLERTPQGNLVRVQTDNTNQPFNINESSKLELGSTAKLRVLVTYLEIIAEIHEKYASQELPALRKALSESPDNLTRWVLGYLMQAKDKSLQATLHAALERRYSASPGERFFTGGGMHTFHNYRNEDNGRNPTLREALIKSINLPFVRALRDVVRYTINQQVPNSAQLLADNRDPRRKEYLARFADREAKVFMLRFWHKYKGKSPDERFSLFVSGLRQHPVRLAAVHRYLYPETDSVSFGKFLRGRLPDEKLSESRIMELYHQYGPDAYNLSDQGYIARAHPLELWLLKHMRQHPSTDWPAVVEASEHQRQEVYAWLFRTRHKHARDSRIRIMLELDAFEDIQPRWQRLGYSFNKLVPSLATALGSSGDRPEALAELMGIIMNKGVRQRTLRIEQLHFAAQTPYETLLSLQPNHTEQVMAPEVATVVREVLLEVVDEGSARRLQGGFTTAAGEVLKLGGKTGTGDNRIVTLSSRGHRISSRSINRTATFVFFLGDNHFGTLTAFVPGREAESFHFTSSLPVQVLRGMAPILTPYLEPDASSPVVQEAPPLAVNEEQPSTVAALPL
ncbi:transglycosylase domain-containing protein [Pontibacter beigongshangensis]|uniref:transglycosylase domain-containing protein n=1 Tax=Pontibacter beigongshangensis TaxID=2574733 RepID=UPI0016505942|nr:transglycosylase domain-containing protein [Pontibacter beigongshangensis]